MSLFINGERREAKSQKSFSNINPATEEILGEIKYAGTEELNEAIKAAREAFKEWSRTPPQQRSQVLWKTADILRQKQKSDQIAHEESLDTGKPLKEVKEVDLPTCTEALEYFAGLARDLRGDQLSLGNSFFYTRREPLGICAGIGAWNYPIQIAAWKSAPALACGNAMIFKPSELTPLTAIRLAEAYREAGAPAGLFQVLQGDSVLGEQMVRHPEISKISLTGEVPTGRAIMKAASDELKALTMELGGKSPLILFDDCQKDQAASAAMLANFFTQGEVCTNGTRVFIHCDCKESITEKLVEKAAKLNVGDPLNSQTHLGSLISKEHMQKVLSSIEKGKAEGAKLLYGGKRLGTKGFFVEPTIFDQCTDSMQIVQEEIFGPVMTILEFENEEEVIERANNTSYGLAAGVFTEDLRKAHRVASRLEAGICWINHYNLTPLEMPFGGVKHSGVGRENGRAVLEHYTQLKSIYVEMDGVEDWP